MVKPNDKKQLTIPEEEVAEVLGDLGDSPKGAPRRSGLGQTHATHRQISFSGEGQVPIPLLLLDKLNGPQIDKVLDNSAKETDQKYQLARQREYSKLLYILAALVLLVLIVVAFWLLKDNENIISILNGLITHLGALVAGVFGGYGYSQNRKR